MHQQQHRLRNVALAIGSVVFLMSGPVSRAQPPSESAGNNEGQPYLGILLGQAEHGVAVREVTPNSPAAKAGIQQGDRITKLDDKDIQDGENFVQLIGSRKPGDKVKLQIMRNDQEKTITVTLGHRPAGGTSGQPGMPPEMSNPFGGQRPAFLGVQTQPLTPEVKQRLSVTADHGVVVTDVVRNSPAAKAGLKVDDVITAVDDQQVTGPGQLHAAIQQAGPGKEVTLHVARGDQATTLKAKLVRAGMGMFLTGGEEQFPSIDVERLFDPARRMRDLEKRITELEKRVQQLEKEKK